MYLGPPRGERTIIRKSLLMFAKKTSDQSTSLSFFIILLLFTLLAPQDLFAQEDYPFDNTPPIMSVGQINGRAFHLTAREENQFLWNVNGEVTGQQAYTPAAGNIWIIDDGPRAYTLFEDDGNRFFSIRSTLDDGYITIASESDGAQADVMPRLAADDPNFERQQFEMIPSTDHLGFYRFKSRVGGKILEVNTNGELILVNNPITAQDRQLFSFRLSMPLDPDRSYTFLNRENKNFLTDQGITDNTVDAEHTEDIDLSITWNFIPLGNDEYYIQNELTGHYLSALNETSAGSIVKATYTLDNGAVWRLERNAATFTIFHKASDFRLGTNDATGDNKPLFLTRSSSIGWRWIVSDVSLGEISPGGGDYNRIRDNANDLIPEDCFSLGSEFQRALLERVGLPDDLAYFPIIEEALTHYYGSASATQQAIQNFSLTDPGHRAELQFAFRTYLVTELMNIPQNQLSNFQALTLSHFETQIFILRQDYGTRLVTAWGDFSSSNLPPTGQATFATLITSLDASNFDWPNEYPLTDSRAHALNGYMNANFTFGNTNQNAGLVITTQLTAAVAVGAVPVISGFALGAAQSAIFSATSLSASAASAASTAVTAVGSFVTVAVMAAIILASEAQKVADVQKLDQKISDKLDWAGLPVSIRTVMDGNNEIDRVKLLADLDYVVAILKADYVYTTNDNRGEDTEASLTCNASGETVFIELGPNGTTTIGINQLSALVFSPCYSSNSFQFSLTENTFTTADLGPQVVDVEATNDLINLTCQHPITVIAAIPPTANCRDEVTLILDEQGMNSVALSDINQASSDNLGIASLELSQTEFSCTDPRVNTVTLTVSDIAGNMSTCETNVALISAVARCQTSTVGIGEDGIGRLFPNQIDMASFSVCGDDIVDRIVTPSEFDCSDIGNRTVSLVVMDERGSQSACTTTVNVMDNIPPSPDQDPLPDIVADCSVTVPVPTATDNCGEVIFATTEDPLFYDEPRTYLITWRFEDLGGIDVTTFLEQRVVITDNTPPVVISVPETIYLCGAQNYNFPDPIVEDACDGTNLQLFRSPDPGFFFPLGETPVDFFYSDQNNNETFVSYNIIVQEPDAGGQCAFLPIELLRFVGSAKEKYVLLEWTTAMEEDNEGFIIEHGTDGRSWSPLGFVPAADQAGDYQFRHEEPVAGLNYYRLRQQDFDGREEVFGPISIDYQEAVSALRLWPNPVRNVVFIGGMEISPMVTVRLLDASGRELLAKTGATSLDVSNFAAGLYTVEVRDGTNIAYQKLIIAH